MQSRQLKRICPLLLGTASLGFVFLVPKALALPGVQSAWNDLLQVYSQTYAQTWQEINAKLGRRLGSAAPQTQAALQQAAGALGIPDPNQARAILMEQASQAPQILTSPEWSPAEQVHELDRQVTRSRNQRVSGQSGQQQRVQELQRIQQIVTATQNQTQQAQQAVSTQSVLKAMAGQAVQQAELLATLTQGQALQQDLSTDTNQNLTNVSETLDSQRRLRRWDRQTRMDLVRRVTRYSSER